MTVATIMCGGSRTPSLICELVEGPRIPIAPGRRRGGSNRDRSLIEAERRAKEAAAAARATAAEDRTQRMALRYPGRLTDQSGKRRNRRMKEPEGRICSVCGKPFSAVMERRRQCSRTCYAKERWNSGARDRKFDCAVCGASFLSKQCKASVCSGDECRIEIGRRGAAKSLTLKPRKFASRLDRWRHYGHMRRAAIAGSETFSASEIYDRDGWRCGLCNKRVDRRLKWPNPLSVSLDHIVPISVGGPHSRANVQCAHLGCNSRKQTGPGGQLRLFG